MSIVSISLDDESIASIDKITSSLGLKGRSEAVRMAIRSATAELKEMDAYEGLVEGVMIIVHEHHDSPWVSLIQHKFEDLIKTQLHSHLRSRMCLELMIMSGDGERIREMMYEVHAAGEAKYVKFVKS